VALQKLIGPELIARCELDVDVLTAAAHTDVVIRIRTPDRPKLLGQYFPFSDDSFNGFTLPYARGWLAAELERTGSPAAAIRLHLDVTEDPDLGISSPLYQVVGRDDLERWRGTVSTDLDEALGRYGVSLVLLAGDLIAGPSLAMLAIVAEALSARTPDHVFDGYAGSAAVAQLALASGVRRVTSVDTHCWGAVMKLLGQETHWSFSQNDAISELASLRPTAADLVVLDPFYGQALSTAVRLTALDLDAPILLNGGPSFLQGWQQRIETTLAASFRHLQQTDLHGERIYECWSKR
jgi:16S rRNA G966 N2-methylase RsmD